MTASYSRLTCVPRADLTGWNRDIKDKRRLRILRIKSRVTVGKLEILVNWCRCLLRAIGVKCGKATPGFCIGSVGQARLGLAGN